MKLKLIIPKLHTKYLSKDDTYQLLLEDQYTKAFSLYTVRDYCYQNKLRYVFPICDDLKAGNYKYYLIRNDEWELDYLNLDNIKESIYNDFELTALQEGKQLLIQGNILIATDRFVSALPIYGDSCTKTSLLLNQRKPMEPIGDINYKCVQIIATGLFNIDYIQEDIDTFEEKDNYIEYEG